MKRSIVFLFFAFSLFTSAQAQVPGTLSYQGILMQSDGITPITDGAHNIVFSFYNVPSAGSALLSRTISVTTAKGLYTCIIGGGTAPNAPFNATEMNQVGSQQIYIGINVDAGGELSPRAQLTPGAYSFRSESVTNTSNPTGGNVSFWATNNRLSSDAGFFWDNTNKRLGIGTAVPLQGIHVNQALTGTALTTPVLARFSNSTTNGHTKVILGTDNVTTDAFSSFTAGATAATQILGFGIGNAVGTTTQLNLNGNGNVGIGTVAPSYKLDVNGNIVNTNPSNGYLGLTGDLPGYSPGTYPTLKTNATYIYFSTGGIYTGYIGGTVDGTFALNNSAAVAKVALSANGSSYLTGGSLGIGTTNPEAPLHVTYSSGTFGLVSRAYFNQPSGPSIIQDFTTTSGISIRADGNILAGSGAFIATSDRRIKDIIARTDSKKDLNNLLQIEIMDYKFIDKISNGDRLHKKVIAQQVQGVYPAAVDVTQGMVPNVLR